MVVPPQQTGRGSWFANAAPVTPGVCRSASINRSCSARRASANRLLFGAPFLGAPCLGRDDAARQDELERDQAVGVEAQRHASQIPQMDDEDGRRRQEREGEGDFGDDERLRQAPRRRGGRRAHAFGEHGVRRRAHRLPERGEAGEHAGGDRHRHAEAEHLPVDADQVDTRDECGRGGQDVPDEDRAQTDAGGGAGDRDERAFGEVAQRELAPRRAERDADRGLAGADDGSRQQQRGDVGAGDEQQESCAAEQDQQRGAEAIGCRFAKGGRVRRVEPIPLRIRRGDDGGDAPDVCPRLFQRDPWFAAGVREVPSGAPVRVARRRNERNPHLGVAASRPGWRSAGGTPVA